MVSVGAFVSSSPTTWPGGAVQMKLKRRYMQTLCVSVKQLRKKLLELGARILHVKRAKQRDMALVVRVEYLFLLLLSRTCFVASFRRASSRVALARRA